MKNQKHIGWLYLIIATIGGFSMGYVPTALIDITDLNLTFNNLKENQLLFKLSIIGDGIVVLLEFFITILLYRLFVKSNKFWNKIAKTSRLSMAVIMAINLIFYIIPLAIIDSEISPTDLFNTCMKTHYYLVYAWQLFFGIHMIFLGALVYNNNNFRHFLGATIFIGGIGYLLDCLIHFASITINPLTVFSNILLAIAAISEISFAVLLVIKKTKVS